MTESLRPVRSLAGLSAYSVPRIDTAIDLYLDSNEGRAANISQLLTSLGQDVNEIVRRYPSTAELVQVISDKLGVTPAQVWVGAGGDEVLDRIMRVYLEPGRTLLMPSPSFEMIERYASLTGATVTRYEWLGQFPRADVIAATQANVIALVSPNNPTGLVVSPEDLDAVASARRDALVIFDHAYAEFADVDLTDVALRHPNVVVVRTLSKAFGVAGLRIGYGVGSETVVAPFAAAGGPYSVSSVSIALAKMLLTGQHDAMRETVSRVRTEREELVALLRSHDVETWPSQANFVFARTPRADEIHAFLASRGISIRIFRSRVDLKNCLRITCPGHPEVFARLAGELTAALTQPSGSSV